VKTSPRCLRDSLRELKTQEGIGLLAELIPLLVVTDCYPEQGLEGEGVRVGVVGFGRR
jgi:hypothetical protein